VDGIAKIPQGLTVEEGATGWLTIKYFINAVDSEALPV
jgi:hypothetical protein